MNNTRKRQHHRVVRTTVSLTPALFDASREIIARYGYTGLSDYLQARIRRDSGLESAVPVLTNETK